MDQSEKIIPVSDVYLSDEVSHNEHAQGVTMMHSHEQMYGEEHIQFGHGSHHHQDGHQCSHHHGEGKNHCIIVYVYWLIISNMYFHYHAYNTQLQGFQRVFSDVVNVFIGVMTLWSYTVTRWSDDSRPTPMKHLKIFQPRPHLDITYQLGQKECKKCDNYKWPRVSHCSKCSSCIYRMDHHCFWTQNCIGIKNYRAFVLFITYAFMGALQHLYYMPKYLYWCWGQPAPFTIHTFPTYIWWVALTFSVVFMGFMIGGLVFSHYIMLSTNFTTLDSYKSKICCPLPFIEWRRPQLKSVNLYDRGEIRNIIDHFGSSLLVFWIPYLRQIDNQFVPEKMSPQPTIQQVKQHDLNMRREDYDRVQKMKTFISNVKSMYKGKKMKIGQAVYPI